MQKSSSTASTLPAVIPIAHGIDREGHAVWLVRSDSQPQRWHIVRLDASASRMVCDCTAFKYNRPCRHRLAVIDRMTAALKAAAAPTPPPPTGGDGADGEEYTWRVTPAGRAALARWQT